MSIYKLQDQGVLDEPLRELDEEDEEGALDDLAAAALLLGVNIDTIAEADGEPTDIGS